MTNQLTGRALDEAVALAMGWTFITFPDGVCPDVKQWKRPTGDLYHWRHCPPYSTDAACIPEMLAWLEGRAYDLEFDWNDRAKRYRARCIWNEGAHGGEGSTLSEALARLVVAVAEAKP